MKEGLPLALTIAIRVVGSLWVVGIVALVLGAPWEIALAAFSLGIAAGIAEWFLRRWPPA
jgi:hypothetical protein